MTRVAKVGDLMSTALIVVHDSDTIGVADAQMKLGAIRHVPVVDAKQNLVGILSVARRAPGAGPRQEVRPGGGDDDP